jgi:hypothetical protein
MMLGTITRTTTALFGLLSAVVISQLICPIAAAQADAATQSAPDLQIAVLQGEDGVNIIKKKTAVKPVVQIRDKNKGPGAVPIAAGVAGVTVLFLLPDNGPSGVFASGSRTMSVVTDANGRAIAGDIRPIGKGSFKVEIRASYHGQTVTRSISQANYSTIAEAHKAGKVPGNSSGDEQDSQGTEEASVGNGLVGASSSAANPVASTAAQAGGHVAKAGGAAGAASHTGLLVTGLAVGGAAAGAAAYETLKNTGPDCTAQGNALITAANNEANVCSTGNLASCTQAAQNALNALGGLCSCVGTATFQSDPSYQQYWQQLQQVASQLGLTLPSSCI